MKRFVMATIAAIFITTVFGVLGSVQGNAHSPAPPQDHILKAWRMDRGSDVYLWSLDDQPERSPGTLYSSLASPALRARVGVFPAGTRLLFFFSGRSNEPFYAVMGKDLEDFREFCKGKRIIFDYSVSTALP